MDDSMSYEPTPKTLRRVVHNDGRHGVQIDDDGHGWLTIQWGTVTIKQGEANVPKPITERVWCHDVTTETEPVYFGTEPDWERQLVYNPMEHL